VTSLTGRAGDRTATVTMKTPRRRPVLTRDDFDALLRPSIVDVIEPHAALNCAMSSRRIP
jgi:hypothetical protein